MKHVTPATLFVGGWFDAEDLAGPLKLFHGVEENGPMAAKRWSWGRGRTAAGRAATGQTLGDLDFASKTGEYFREKIELRVFRQEPQGQTGEATESFRRRGCSRRARTSGAVSNMAAGQAVAPLAVSSARAASLALRATTATDSTSTSAIPRSRCRCWRASARACRATT